MGSDSDSSKKPSVVTDQLSDPTVQLQLSKVREALAVQLEQLKAAPKVATKPEPATAPAREKIISDSTQFVTLPKDAPAAGPKWLVQFKNLKADAPTLGVRIVGDVVLGVNRPGAWMPDLDLAPYGGLEKGISRRHAMLRPTADRLLLTDLQSTNGTHVNGMKINAGVPKHLEDNDTITLGALTFTVSMMLSPHDFDSLENWKRGSANKPE
jgi:hypothetical protein